MWLDQLLQDTSNDTERMVEVPLDSLSLTWGTAWEARECRHTERAVNGRAVTEVLDLDFFTSSDVMHFTKRAFLDLFGGRHFGDDG